MSDIEIRRAHAMPVAHARAEAEKVAAQLKDRLNLDYSWEGDALIFSRLGISGRLNVTPTEVTMSAKLGFMFGFLKPQIEQHIRDNLHKVFGPEPAAAAKLPAKIGRRAARPAKPAAPTKPTRSVKKKGGS